MIDIRRGLEILKKNIRIAPEKPGVYRMLGEGGKVLYVGKAKNIKKRIVAYSHIEKLPVRLQRMVSESNGWSLSSSKTRRGRCCWKTG